MISILLATYNGEKYIAGQIESLLSQTYKDFKLYICDDKSTDDTYSIITDHALKNPAKIIASQNEINAGGAKYNFIKMLMERKADLAMPLGQDDADDYIMLCDQDDVWLPDKIENSLKKIKENSIIDAVSGNRSFISVDENNNVNWCCCRDIRNNACKAQSIYGERVFTCKM